MTETDTCAICGGGCYQPDDLPMWLHMDPEYLASPHHAQPVTIPQPRKRSRDNDSTDE